MMGRFYASCYFCLFVKILSGTRDCSAQCIAPCPSLVSRFVLVHAASGLLQRRLNLPGQSCSKNLKISHDSDFQNGFPSISICLRICQSDWLSFLACTTLLALSSALLRPYTWQGSSSSKRQEDTPLTISSEGLPVWCVPP